MNPKQKAITEAYKALGMDVPEMADENGWSKDKDLATLPGFVEIFDEGQHVWLYRPISLTGLENNKGWKRVEDGLPDQDSNYLVGIFRSDGNFYTQEVNLFQAIHLISKTKYTHYMPINKPEPPLY